MGYVEKRNGRHRARYRDALGIQRSKTFTRSADAERFLRENQVDIDRGNWLDPKGAELTVKEWSDQFMSLARRLAVSTQQTYQRDLDSYILPRFGAYRLANFPQTRLRTG